MGNDVIKKRLFGYDLLKVIAMLMVPCLHFCLYSGYYNEQLVGTNMVFYLPVRQLFYQCVPIFLLLSGALNGKAEFGRKHYIKLTPIIVNSLIVALVVIMYRVLYLKEQVPLIIWLKEIWTFTEPGYGWYINLYISLFL